MGHNAATLSQKLKIWGWGILKGTPPPPMKLENFLIIKITNFYIKQAVPSKIRRQTLPNLQCSIIDHF